MRTNLHCCKSLAVALAVALAVTLAVVLALASNEVHLFPPLLPPKKMALTMQPLD